MVTPTPLYLDTARLGLMSPSAQQAIVDFTRLGIAGEAPFWLYFERFVERGAKELPLDLRQHYTGLRSWHGVARLKQSLAQLVGASSGQRRVLLASRSANLVRLGLRELFRRRRQVLVTDLTWPGYRPLIKRQAKSANATLIRLPVRNMLKSPDVSAAELADYLVRRAAGANVDGLFLPAITHDGVRLPVGEICRQLKCHRHSVSVVVDGAQEFCHAPAHGTLQYADFYVASCHKWLGAYLPLAIAVQRKSFRSKQPCRGPTCLTDPILKLTQHSSSLTASTGETVNLSPLFSCAGAVRDAQLGRSTSATLFSARLANATVLAAVAEQCGWQPLMPGESLRSGVLLLQSANNSVRDASPLGVRQHFLTCGISLTAYTGGIIRLSMPSTRWQTGQLELLSNALAECPFSLATQPLLRLAS